MTKRYPRLRRVALHAVTVLVLVLVWSITRAGSFAIYQRPPAPAMHANYYTFHEMSVRLDEGAPLGNINITRMVRQAGPYAVYDTSVPPASVFCDYYTLDAGFGYVVHAARHLFTTLPDNFLRTLALQVVADLAMLFAIYGFLQYLGWLPAAVGGLLYATNPVLAYVPALTFYYFWDGVLAVTTFGLLTTAAVHLGRTRTRRLGIALLTAMGLVLGLGAWLRASWIPYAAVIFTVLLLPRRMRRAVPYALLGFAVFAAPAVIRASRAEGRLATSTRMTWHTAHAALGRFPNVYGLEDDDGYQFELGERAYGVKYNFCSYRAQDNAMRQHYAQIYRDNPEFVVRSVLTRIYLNVFWNANENYRPLWNWWLLGMAAVGAVPLVLRGGHRRALALTAGALYGAACAAVGFVYYMNPNYANVTQLCLIFLACGVPDVLSQLGHLRGFARLSVRAWPLLLATIIAVTAGWFALTRPAVQDYLSKPRSPEQWLAAAEIPPAQVDALIEQFNAAPVATQAALVARVRRDLPDAPAAPADAVAAFIRTRLRLIQGYRTGFPQEYHVYVVADAGQAAFDAIRRSAQFILGWRAVSLIGFTIDDPASWDGITLKIDLDPAAEGGADRQRVRDLVEEKFVRRGFTRVGPAGDAIVYRLTAPATP